MNKDNSSRGAFFVASAEIDNPTGQVRVLDTTLRDGEQTPGVHIGKDAKVDVAKRLEAYGVTTIEIPRVLTGRPRRGTPSSRNGHTL